MNRITRYPLFFTASIALALSGSNAFAERGHPTPWSHYVEQTLDTLIDRGTDRYGEVHSPMLMSVLDVRTLDSPASPDEVGSLIRLEGRIHRRGERGSNLWNDQPTVRALSLMTQLSGDAKYQQAADDYVAFVYANCRSSKKMLYWGTHVHWDCFRDRPGGDGDGRGPHEILINDAQWADMFRVAPEAVQDHVDGIWQWHVHDKETGRHNRHDDNAPGREFSFSGGSFVVAFASMYRETGEEHYLDKAKLVADWHYRNRDSKTDLPSELPGLAHEENGLYGRAFMTTLTGPHSAALLRAYEITGDEHFYHIATTYLKRFDEFSWQDSHEAYVGMLNLDGSPTTIDDVPRAMRSQVVGYGSSDPDPEYSVPPIGPMEIWQTTIYPLEFPIASAQSAVYAYELSKSHGQGGDEQLLQSALRWATFIEANLPPKTGRTFRNRMREALPELQGNEGTYAGNYGRAISFYVHLYRATGDDQYLAIARSIAQQAVDKLFVQTAHEKDSQEQTYGLFKGHPAKPYYEAVDGVGLLLIALLELDHPEKKLGWAF